MSLKSRFISLFASAVVLGSFAVVASAQGRAPVARDGVQKSEKHGEKGFGKHDGSGMGMRGGMRGGFGFRGIELTDAQREQMKQIRETNRPAPAIMEEMKAIREARRAGTITEAQKDRALALREQVRLHRESVREQMLAVLTPEQRQQLEARKAEMQQRRERRQQRQLKRQAAPPTTNDNL